MLVMLSALAVQTQSLTQPDVLEHLMARLAQGDRDAMEDLYRRTRTSVYALALSHLKNGHDAEDVTQDTFVRAWEAAPTYRPQGKPLAWLLTIARNLALMRIRDRGKSQQLESEEWERIPLEGERLTAEDKEVLFAALKSLTDQERQVVLLHAVTGLKHREIAVLLEMPLATALSKYHRAIKKLKLILEGDGAR